MSCVPLWPLETAYAQFLLLGVSARDRSIDLCGPNRNPSAVRVSSGVVDPSICPDGVSLVVRACDKALSVEGKVVRRIKSEAGALGVRGGGLSTSSVPKDTLAHAGGVDVRLLVWRVGAVKVERAIATKREGRGVGGAVAGGALGGQSGEDGALGRLKGRQMDI